MNLTNVKAHVKSDGTFVLEGVLPKDAVEEAVGVTVLSVAPTGKEIKQLVGSKKLAAHPRKEKCTPAQIGSYIASFARSLPKTCTDKWSIGAQQKLERWLLQPMIVRGKSQLMLADVPVDAKRAKS